MLRSLNKINKLSIIRFSTPPSSILNNIFFDYGKGGNGNNDQNKETKEDLIINIINNPSNQYLYLKLSNLMEKEEKVEIFKKDPYNSNDNNGCQLLINKFKKIDLLLMTLHLQNNNSQALELVTNYMYNEKLLSIKMFDGNLKTFKELSYQNFKFNKSIESYLKLSESLNDDDYDDDPNKEIQMYDGSSISKIQILTECFIVYPNQYDVRYFLAKSLKNNTDTIELPFLKNSSAFYYSENIKFTRLELLKDVLENKSNLLPQFSNLSEIYLYLSTCLDSNNITITINNINHNKISLFEESIKLK